jgi:hypothetical protein
MWRSGTCIALLRSVSNKFVAALVLLAILLGAKPASAANEHALQLSIVAGNAFDLTTTLALGHRPNIVEANVLMWPATIPLKASAAGVEMYMVHRLWHRGQHRAAAVAALGVLASNTLIAVHNIRVTR